MDLAVWALIATVVAGGASLVGIIAVVYQLRSLTQQTREQARQAEASVQAILTSTYLEVVKCQIDQDRFLAEHPELRGYLYGRVRGFGSQRRLHRAEAAAEMFVDMVDLSIMLQSNLPYEMTVFWESYAKDLMERSSRLRVYWRENRGWYHSAVQEFFDKALRMAVAPERTKDLTSRSFAETAEPGQVLRLTVTPRGSAKEDRDVIEPDRKFQRHMRGAYAPSRAVAQWAARSAQAA